MTTAARSRGETRRAQLAAALSGRQWEWVRAGYDETGVHSVTGFRVKAYHVIRDKDTGEEVMVGRGEMLKYAGVTPPTRPRGRPRVEVPDFEFAFAESRLPKTGA